MNTEEWLSQEKQISLTLAEKILAEQYEKNKHLNSPMRFLLQELKTYCLRGGKWARPTLVRVVISLLDTKITPGALAASLCTEFIHRYILIQDDVIDQDLNRHGGPTIQKIYQQRHRRYFAQFEDATFSLGSAIVAGDVLCALTYSVVADSTLNPVQKMDVIRSLNQEMIETVSGWIFETELKHKSLADVKLKDVYTSMTLVSANYSVLWPLRIGQVLAGKKFGEWIPEIEIYGTHVGLAFQIQDDILAIFGNQQETGKPVGNDLREGKKTLLTSYAYEHASLREKEVLDKTLHTPVTLRRLNQIRKIFETTGALAFAKKEALRHAKKGATALEKLTGIHEPSRRLLCELADFMTSRSV
jgi:geranylgeranyl diphosphate synthase, type I